jgi:single-strand DNA-binding protein
VNLSILIGNLTRDPEMSYTPQGTPVTKFSIATSAGKKEGKERPADFHNIIAWGNEKPTNLAIICAQYLKKGSKVCVSGRHTTREWEATDGSKRRTCEVIASNVEFLSPKEKEEDAEQ